jgi:hypothetical protein
LKSYTRINLGNIKKLRWCLIIHETCAIDMEWYTIYIRLNTQTEKKLKRPDFRIGKDFYLT